MLGLIMITVRPLPALERSLMRALISGYTSAESFSFTSDGSWDHLLFEGVLVPCDPPFTRVYPLPGAEALVRYGALAAADHTFGAYEGARCVGLAIGELTRWNRSPKLWELRVAPDWLRRGVGRALVEDVVTHARKPELRRVWLETPSTNVPAIRLYAPIQFIVVGLDLGLYASTDAAPGEIAFFMVRNLG